MMLIGSGIIFGLALMAMICGICLVISFLCGAVAYKWFKYSSKEKGGNRYQQVINSDSMEHF